MILQSVQAISEIKAVLEIHVTYFECANNKTDNLDNS